jgi:2-polyprenyl-3-methyl-5-hydroxy-6-metoxy-1,4-benzoquinol methylase
VNLKELFFDTRFNNLSFLIKSQVQSWPEHTSFLEKSLSERDEKTLEHSEKIASQIFKIAGNNIERYCLGYRWMCNAVLEEEIYFRRNHSYRSTNFAQVQEAIYNNQDAMGNYMAGLLLSQIFWRNHVDISSYFEVYLNKLKNNYKHLEIGPGHGLFLARATQRGECHESSAWDISDTSLTFTRECLSKIGVTRNVMLEKRNVFDLTDSSEKYDSIVMAEVLEHLENPTLALEKIRNILAPGGLAFFNIPCNSPAPDHIYLYKNPSHFFEQLTGAGFNIIDQFVTPGTGFSLERALKANLPISCAAIVSAD